VNKIAFEVPLTKCSLCYGVDMAFYKNRSALSLGLEVDLFRQELPKDTRAVARRYDNRLRAVMSRRCHGVTGHGVVGVAVTTP